MCVYGMANALFAMIVSLNIYRADHGPLPCYAVISGSSRFVRWPWSYPHRLWLECGGTSAISHMERIRMFLHLISSNMPPHFTSIPEARHPKETALFPCEVSSVQPAPKGTDMNWSTGSSLKLSTGLIRIQLVLQRPQVWHQLRISEFWYWNFHGEVTWHNMTMNFTHV